MARRPLLSAQESAIKEMKNMRYPDLKAACIMKGMDPMEVVESDHGMLATYFLDNTDQRRDRSLLEDFDIWQDLKLAELGYELDDPLRVYRQFSNLDEDENIAVKTRQLRRANVPNKKREKKKRSKFGIFSGTKKEFTYILADDLINAKGDKYTNKELMKKYAKKLVRKVQVKFPEAVAKSVRIWMKRALEAIRPPK